MKKIAVVTGGTRGLGYEIAKQLGDNNFRVVITGTQIEKVEEKAKQIEKMDIDVIGMQLDLRYNESIDSFVTALNQFDKIDLLVNNAAILSDSDRGKKITEIGMEIFEETMQINFLGQVRLTHKLLPLLTNNSQIINIGARPALFSNLSAKMSMAAAYQISKLAFHGWAVMLAEVLREREIRVTTMHPGWVRTDMGGSKAHRSIEEGVDTVIWLALESTIEMSGKMFQDREEIAW